MTKWFPDRKWFASGISGFVTFGLTLLFADALGMAPEPTAALASALTAIVMQAVHYFVPQSVKDIIKRVDDAIIDMARKSPDSPASPQ
jgi:hypothetical protein